MEHVFFFRVVFSSQATTHTNVTLPILNTNVMFLSLKLLFFHKYSAKDH
jgi:hypothetical protein